eukprot:GHVN01019746.1.p2 GENE.GHVN01019746.1~~GHVN01019746.1.p2  ORF type:complete len:115 (-),score=1.20 GHVN01019746.1:705-1049(-)
MHLPAVQYLHKSANYDRFGGIVLDYRFYNKVRWLGVQSLRVQTGTIPTAVNNPPEAKFKLKRPNDGTRRCEMLRRELSSRVEVVTSIPLHRGRTDICFLLGKCLPSQLQHIVGS